MHTITALRMLSGGACAAALGLALSACSPAKPDRPPGQLEGISLIFVNANVVTMDARGSRGQAIAVDDQGHVVMVGSNHEVGSLAGPSTRTIDGAGMTILPGFIDPHSHMAGYAMYNDPEHWIDVSSINIYFKPAPGTPACLTPDDPQRCFIPVRTQQDVVARIKAGVARARNLPIAPAPPVLAFNYDPSRLGHGPDCPGNGQGLACPNFENGHSREQLDAIASDVPIYVTSESGHISYANTPALKLLNICGTLGLSPGNANCHQPTTNPNVEMQLAATGQLDEDLSLYATAKLGGQVLKDTQGLGQRLLQKAAEIYAQHGYTLSQEGAATLDDTLLYLQAVRGCRLSCAFPLSAAMVAYDPSAKDFSGIVATGLAANKLIGAGTPLLSVAWLKSFTDGSPQGYTAFLNAPYLNFYWPFTSYGIFPAQPYAGLPDLSEPQIEERLRAAHAAGFPMLIHQIGDAAIGYAVDAIMATRDSAPPAGKRDVVLHAPMISGAQLDRLKTLTEHPVVVSIMSSNVYYYGLPECQQVLGPQRTVNFYPARSVVDRGLHLTLHSDSPVTPPYPLFEIWAAVTRKIQQPSWYRNENPAQCPTVFANHPQYPGDERISILDGIRAFTTNAAWQYGMERERGSLEAGKIADMVLLSDDPLKPLYGADPDQLRNIRVLGTVSYGRYLPNPHADAKPVWPD